MWPQEMSILSDQNWKEEAPSSNFWHRAPIKAVSDPAEPWHFYHLWFLMDGCSKVIYNIHHHFHWLSWQIPSFVLQLFLRTTKPEGTHASKNTHVDHSIKPKSFRQSLRNNHPSKHNKVLSLTCSWKEFTRGRHPVLADWVRTAEELKHEVELLYSHTYML